MFGKKKKKEAEAAAAPPGDTPEADTTEFPVEETPAPDAADMPTGQAMPEPAMVEEEAAEPAVAVPATGNGAGGNGAGGNGVRHSPREAARVSMDDFVGNPRTSEDQRQQAAAAELMSAIGPAQQMLMEQVPDASSPDDAASRLMDRQNERPVLHDPEGESLRGADIYRTDASVYYRLQKQFTWKPQPGPYKTRWLPTTLAEPRNDTTRRKLPKGR